MYLFVVHSLHTLNWLLIMICCTFILIIHTRYIYSNRTHIRLIVHACKSYKLYCWNYSLRLWVLSHYSVGISLTSTRPILCPLWQSNGNLPCNALDQFLRVSKYPWSGHLSLCRGVIIILCLATFYIGRFVCRMRLYTPDHMINSLAEMAKKAIGLILL